MPVFEHRQGRQRAQAGDLRDSGLCPGRRLSVSASRVPAGGSRRGRLIRRKKFGARYLVAGQVGEAIEVLEGDWMPKKLTVIEFPSKARGMCQRL